MIKIYKYGEVADSEVFARVTPKVDVAAIVSDIIANVRERGDRAVLEYCERFDKAKLDSLEVSEAEIDEAFELVEEEFKDIMRRAAENIRAFHSKQVKNSFVISKSAKDGYHPNQLTGYITALMTYCAITGESAVGQPYDFWNDTSLDGRFSSDLFISTYYTHGSTNYPDIFASGADMRGLQELIDRYLAQKDYREYRFEANGAE
jgi:hypothetical protein